MINSKTIYGSSAKAWTEALPLGNGSLGAMVFFDSDVEKISLNHDTLWSGVPQKDVRIGAKESYEKAKAFALEEKYYEAQTELDDNFLDKNSEFYLPLGDLLIEFGHKNVFEYVRELDFETAVASCRYSVIPNERYCREAFVSFPKKTLVYAIFGKGAKVNFKIRFESKLKGRLYSENDVLIFDGECPGYSYALLPNNKNEYEYFNGRYTKGISFRSAARVKCFGGKAVVSDEGITVENAESAIVYFVTETNFAGAEVYPEIGGKEYKNLALKTLNDAFEIDYDDLKKEHIDDFSLLYNRVRLDLGTSGKDGMFTDERLISFEKDKDDASIYKLLFDFARYLTISASREGSKAMNLQGIWNDRPFAPWRSNYTVNINTQMNYWPTLPFGLVECCEPLVDLLKTISKTGVKTAREYYGARGFAAHHNIDIWGHTSAVVKRSQWGYWQGGSGWLSRHLFEQYEYTLDREFLQFTAFPIIKEAALFYMDILTEVEDGYLAIVPATSPENQFFDCSGRVVATAKYTAMMNCIAKETLENAIKCCEILGIEDDFKKEALEKSLKIAPLKIGTDGRLLEWNGEFAETDVNHRHISHLYALHPADMITEKTPQLMAAAKKTLAARGDDGTGWSLGWKINFYARLGEGNKALELMERQLRFVDSNVTDIRLDSSGTYANLFDAHPPFQIDGNFGFASGVFEMLARVIGNELYLLPALPEKWKNGRIDGMRIKGNCALSMEWKDGELLRYEIIGKKGFKVIYKGKCISDESF